MRPAIVEQQVQRFDVVRARVAQQEGCPVSSVSERAALARSGGKPLPVTRPVARCHRSARDATTDARHATGARNAADARNAATDPRVAATDARNAAARCPSAAADVEMPLAGPETPALGLALGPEMGLPTPTRRCRRCPRRRRWERPSPARRRSHRGARGPAPRSGRRRQITPDQVRRADRQAVLVEQIDAERGRSRSQRQERTVRGQRQLGAGQPVVPEAAEPALIRLTDRREQDDFVREVLGYGAAAGTGRQPAIQRAGHHQLEAVTGGAEPRMQRARSSSAPFAAMICSSPKWSVTKNGTVAAPSLRSSSLSET